MQRAQDRLQREGRACYKRKDYAKALEFFDRAIGRSPTVQLLDNRAACYEKVDELPKALKDAKQAIHLQKEDPTGYLRAGKVLVKMGKQSVALELYVHGLKSVKHAGQGYELLRRARDKLQTEVSPPKSVDPFTLLPNELAAMVLEYLSFTQRMNACLVSKSWARFIRSIPELWEHLDLSQARRKVRTAFVSRAINAGRTELTKATLSNIFDFEKSLDALIRHCRIEELRLLDTGLQSDSLRQSLSRATHLRKLCFGAGTQIGRYTWNGILRSLADQLESLEYRSTHPSLSIGIGEMPLSKLRNLSLDVVSLDPAFYSTFEEMTPELRSLQIRETTPLSRFLHVTIGRLTRLESFDVDVRCSFHLDLGSNPPPLSRLRLATNANIITSFDDTGCPGLPALQELALHLPFACSPCSSINMMAHLSHSSTTNKLLERLIARLPFGETDVTTDEFFSYPRLKALKHLEVGGGDDVAEIVARRLPLLETVNMSDSEITGVGVKALAGLPKVRRLVLNNCRLLGRDAVDWARSQGIEVESKTANLDAGGKKVRY